MIADCRIYRVAGQVFISVCTRRMPVSSDGVMVTLVTDDVDGWHTRLLHANVQCDRRPRRNDACDLYYAFCRDSDGHIIEVQTFLDPPRSDALASGQ